MIGFIKEPIPQENPIVPDGFRHALCTGETGSGKTSGFMLPNIEDRLQKGHGIFAIDFKGNLNLQIKTLAEQEGRLADVVEIGVPWGTSINILAGLDRNLFIDTLHKTVIDNDKDLWLTSATNIAGRLFDILTYVDYLKEMISPNDIREYPNDYALDMPTLVKITNDKKALISFCENISNFLIFLSHDTMLQWMLMRHEALISQYIGKLQPQIEAVRSFANDID